MASTDIFQQVSLAEAAYADFRGVDFDDTESEQRLEPVSELFMAVSKAVGHAFSQNQAEAFVDP